MSNPTDNQLPNYREEHKDEHKVLATAHGIPVGDKKNVITAGPRGPILLQDSVFIDEMAHFDRERIPERVVHAKGAGAFGYFECTHDITKYTKASPFSKIGKKTDLFLRFSTVSGESGSADTVRNPRGFAIKFYTDTGNWDLVGNNTPIFFIRDPIFFPSFIHTQKRNPRTHLKDANMVWDFMSLRPETTHQYLFLFADRGIPDGFRHMHGYGSHTFKLVNDKNEAVYCKFHFRTEQGVKNLCPDKAGMIAGSDADYAIRDLYNAIENKNHPSWKLFIQVMTYKEAETYQFNPFDVTKVWSQKKFPLIEVGKLVLNRNPKNYFLDVEQAGFCPANMIPGIEASPDKMLQGRMFSYNDTLRHRLGANFHQIPVNAPRCPFSTYQRDGPMRTDDNSEDMPNYFPNSFGGPTDDRKHLEKAEPTTGDADRHDSSNEDNFTQPKIFYNEVLDHEAKLRLAKSIGGNLFEAKEFIRARVLKTFMNVSEELSANIMKHMESLGVKTCLNCQL